VNDRKQNLSELLASVDAAPVRELTKAEKDRKEHLLRTVIDSAPAPADAAAAPRRRRPVLWLAGGAAVATAAVLVCTQAVQKAPGSGGPLSTGALASWTATPSKPPVTSPVATAAEKWCVNALKDTYAGTPVSYSNVEVRGSATSMVVTGRGTISYCLTDKAGHGMSEVIDPVAKLAGNAIEVDSAGAHGEGSTGFTYLVGSVGVDVKAVTLHDKGRTIEASIQSGRFTAWWPSPEPTGSASGDVVITLNNGSTRTVPGDSIFRKG
jgi:hypothetical protein